VTSYLDIILLIKVFRYNYLSTSQFSFIPKYQHVPVSKFSGLIFISVDISDSGPLQSCHTTLDHSDALSCLALRFDVRQLLYHQAPCRLVAHPSLLSLSQVANGISRWYVSESPAQVGAVFYDI